MSGSWGGGGGGGGGGWGGWSSGAPVRSKMWAQDSFIAEYCDTIADDLIASSDVTGLMSSFNDCVAKLCAMCDDPANPTEASLLEKYEKAREEEREKDLAEMQRKEAQEHHSSAHGAVVEAAGRGGMTIGVGTSDGIVFRGSQYASGGGGGGSMWDSNKVEKDAKEIAAEKEKQELMKRLCKQSTLDMALRKKAVGPLMKLRLALDRSDGLYKKFDGFIRWRMQFYVSKMVPEICTLVRKMKAVGDFVIMPVVLPSGGGIQVNMLVEYESPATVRICIMNPQPYTEYHPQTAQANSPSKLKQLVALSVPGIEIRKITSEAWWSMVYLSALTLNGGEAESVFYTHFVTWLTDKTYEASIQACVDEGVYATPAKSVQTSYWKSLIHTLKYTLRRAGLDTKEVKLLRHQIKKIFLWEVENDLSDVKGIKLATKKIIGAALQNTSLSITRNSAQLSEKVLAESRTFIENLSNRLEAFACDDDGITPPPPKLNVTEGWDRSQQCDSFPLVECFRRTSGVDQFAGAAIEQARLMPTNFLRLPGKVTDFTVALEAIDECVQLCTRLCASMNNVKNTGHLVYAAVAHLVIEVLPVPLGPKSRADKNLRCIWSDTPLRYGQQLHLLKRLHELCEYFVFSVFTLQDPLHENEGLRVVVTGVLSTIADAAIRIQASDRPSLFSVHYGGFYKNKPGFAIMPGDFANGTQWLNFFNPEALVCRAQVLDYFTERRDNVPDANIIWKWENGVETYEDKPAGVLCRQMSHAEALMARGGLPWRMLGTNNEGPVSMLCRHFVEINYFRNITLYFFHQMNGEYVSKQDYLTTWPAPATFLGSTVQGAWKTHGFHGAQLRTKPRTNFDYLTAPKTYTKPEQVVTEDDVLHVRNLPTFEDVLGQRDSELLLSYLTVPYIRIPLILRFLATEDRVSCLRSRTIQNLVTAVLFEGGRFLDLENSGKVPKQVPSEEEKLIATPYGPLCNELFHSCDGVLDPILRLLELACELDAGTVFNKSATDVILYLVRTVARILNFTSLCIDLSKGDLKRHRFVEHRDVPTDPKVLTVLVAARIRIFDNVHEKVYPMLDTWVAEAMRAANEAKKTEDIDSSTLLASTIFSHMVLLHRTFKDDEWKNENVSRLLSCFTFLTTRHSWTGSHLPEIELYYIIHRQRRSIVKYLTLSPPEQMGQVLDNVVRIVTNAQQRPGERTHPWALVAGVDCVGRFARVDEEVTKKAAALKEKNIPELLASLKHSLNVDALPSGSETVAEGSQSVELNLQTLTLTFKSAHLVALPTETAHDMNTIIVFTTQGLSLKLIEALQCAVVQETTNRIWVRLVGQDHDAVTWRTPDQRFSIPDDKMMRFYPDDIAETEKWVFDIFEPVRKSYFERNFWDPPIFMLLPEQKLTPDNCVATLQAVDSQSGRKLKEVVVLRDFRCVHIYDVFSHARRFYRSLVYSSDNRYCMRQLHPSIDRRQAPWLPWARHEAGNPDPDASLEQNSTTSILRHMDHPDNASGSTEMYVPKDLLNGLIPSSLCDTHMFWQDEDDNIRGYPLPPSATLDPADKERNQKEAPPHLLWLHWREMQFDAFGFKNTGMRVMRFARKDNAPKASEEAATYSKKLKKETVVQDDDDGAMSPEKEGSDESSTTTTGAAAAAAAAEKKKEAKKDGKKDGDGKKGADGKKGGKPDIAEQGTAVDDDSEYYEKGATREVGLYRESEVAKSTAPAATIEDKDLLLLNLLYAREGTPLHSLALVLARIELLSHVLVWTTQTDYDSSSSGPATLDLIQLPRLKLTFTARLSADRRTYLIYSMDHSHLYISNLRQPLVTSLIQGVPHSLLMQDTNGAISILVPALNLARPAIGKAPFSTELVINRSDTQWYTKLDTRYYLYPVHVSLSFMFTPTLASALYLLLLRFYNRNYTDVFRIASTIGTDMELTPEEYQIFNKLYFISDIHPNAHACRAKISLLVSDSPILLGWYTPREVALLVAKQSGVSVGCRLAAGEERRLLYLAVNLDEKMRIIREFLKDETIKETGTLAMSRIAASDATKSLKLNAPGKTLASSSSSQQPLTPQQQTQIRDLYVKLTNVLREKLDVRVRRDDLMRLLTVFNNFAQDPMQPYLACLLRNRRAIIEGEFAAAAEGKRSIEIELGAPPLGKDLQWRFYRDYRPLDTKLPGSAAKPINSDNRVMNCAPRYDYYYCGLSGFRKPQTCRCRGCQSNCGPAGGCPCPACEEWNRTQAEHHLELLPNLDNSKTAKQLSFFEAFQWIVDALQKYNNAKMNPEFPFMERAVPASIRDPENAFLRFYEIIQGTTKIKIGQDNCARDFADILFHFTREARNKVSPLGHLMHFVVATPQSWSKIPKWNRSSKEKMDQRISGLYKGIISQAGIHNAHRPVDPATFPKCAHQQKYKINLVPRKVTRGPGEPLEATTVLPIPANTALREFLVDIPDLKQLRLIGEEARELVVLPELLQQLAGQPLTPALVGDEQIVIKLGRKEQKLDVVPDKLPFDLNKHEHATKAVARNMIKRIEQDVADFAARENAASVPRIDTLASVPDVQKLVIGAPSDASRKITARLEATMARLAEMREKDIRFIAYSMPAVTRTANFVDVTGTDRQSTLIFLRRFAGKEANLTVDFLFSLLCSDAHLHEARQLNPFLTNDQCRAIAGMCAVTVLIATRIAHANRTSELIADILDLLGRATRPFPEALRGAALDKYKHGLATAIKQSADALAKSLITKRVFMKPSEMVKGAYILDPRFLIYEFTWNLVLRGRQTEIINEMYQSVLNNQPNVKQAIMGAGKTTVIGPLLSLLLSDGTNLVVQVVPPALLEFTRSVLRTTFSSVLQKQIFTFNCDRAYEVDSEAIIKFEHAKNSRGIVVTTPSSLKSVFLKYIEGLDRVVDNGRKRTQDMVKEIVDLSGVLEMWRKGVLIMDEVDLLLHPLKSELNFPIGAKQAIDFTPMRWKLPIHILDSIFYYHTRRLTTSLKESPEAFAVLERFEKVIQDGLNTNALQEMPHLTLLNMDFYKEKLLPVMIDWVIMFLKAQHLRGLTDEETGSYLRGRPAMKNQKVFHDKIAALDGEHVQMLNLCFDWVNNFMPHIMQKVDRVSFGIMNNDDMKRAREDQPNMPASRFVTAIPFIGKDLPSQSSEFAHPDIVIGLTVLAYRYEGLRESDFSEILGAVHASVEKEVGRYSQRRSNIMFNKWVGAAGGRVVATHQYKKKPKDTKGLMEINATAGDGDDDMGMQPSESMVVSESHVDPAVEQGAAAAAAADSGSKKGHREKKAKFGELDVLPLKLMRQANQDEVKKLFSLLRRTGEVIHWYLCDNIFPKYMRHQVLKLSASGQELGGNIIFQRRVGFSGTPSDLLPIELGVCQYETATDGQLLYTLTDPETISFTVAKNGWTVRDLLDLIAKSDPPYNALIDTGALITGMSNLQVAQYLLKHGLPDKEGVVFLDEYDRKMILVRATNRVLKLAECGLPKAKRFAFYDQVHTTGMDIDHTPNAVAIQTLGKDMTFRDFAQGAYRMRGIGQGQKVELLIIPEVNDLINRSLLSVLGKTESDVTKRPVQDVLQSVTAWLLVNSIRSEHIQHNQLCLQNCANVWRKEAFRVLSERRSEFRIEDDAKLSDEAAAALEVFREPVSFAIHNIVPQPRMFSEAVAAYVEAHAAMVRGDSAKKLVDEIVASTKREDEIENPTMDVQMVQEQEEEREKEEEKEKEQEIEIEKFVDLDYTRDEETGSPWMLETLADFKRAAHFYPMSEFRLYKRRPLKFPASILLSRNHFDSRWAGHRRLKNVCITLEWIPDTGAMSLFESPTADYNTIDGDAATKQLLRTLESVAAHQGAITEDLVKDILSTALHPEKRNPLSETELRTVAKKALERAKELAKGGAVKAQQLTAAVMELLSNNKLRNEQKGRYTVALSLAEAETLRRVLHIEIQRPGKAVPPGAAFCLNVVPSGNVLLDETPNFVAAPTSYQQFRNFQALRFFDGDLHYSETEFGLLLRSLHNNQSKLRQAFFQQVIACRRRARQRWESTPIATLFKMENAYTLLQQRAVGLCMRREIDRLDLSFGDAFISFNSSHSGQISVDELWGALRFCRLTDLTADDVLNFLDVADTHHEGHVNYSDFVAVLTGKRDEEEDTAAPSDQDAQGKKLPTVPPHGAEELGNVKADREKTIRAQEAEASKELESENRRVLEEIENEQISNELTSIIETGNPFIMASNKSLLFSYAHPQPPRLLNGYGMTKPRIMKMPDDPNGPMAEPTCRLASRSSLHASLRVLKRIAAPEAPAAEKPASGETPSFDGIFPYFSITMELRLPVPPQGDSKVLTLKHLKNTGAPLDLVRWPLRVYRFAGYNSLTGVIPFEADLYGVTTDGSGTSKKDTQDVIHVFREPRPPRTKEEAPDAFVAIIKAPEFAEVDDKKTSNVIDGVTYEWMHIVRPVEGWVVKEKSNRPLWSQMFAAATLTDEGVTILHNQQKDVNENIMPYRIEGTAADGELEEGDMEDKNSTKKDDTVNAEITLSSDVHDLLEAIRQAKKLKPGDKIARNPSNWERGNEDGGAGSIGKVLSVSEDEVQVQWPSGNKCSYSWGRGGRYEIVKVADGEEGDDGRETLNNDAHVPELRKGGKSCGQCGAQKLEVGNWYKCFTADTPVTMADGSCKAIRDVCKGDRVLSMVEAVSPKDRRVVPSTVIGLFNTTNRGLPEEDIWRVTLADGRALFCTADHKFYVNGAWVEAKNLPVTNMLAPEGSLGLHDALVTEFTVRRERAEAAAAEKIAAAKDADKPDAAAAAAQRALQQQEREKQWTARLHDASTFIAKATQIHSVTIGAAAPLQIKFAELTAAERNWSADLHVAARKGPTGGTIDRRNLHADGTPFAPLSCNTPEALERARAFFRILGFVQSDRTVRQQRGETLKHPVCFVGQKVDADQMEHDWKLLGGTPTVIAPEREVGGPAGVYTVRLGGAPGAAMKSLPGLSTGDRVQDAEQSLPGIVTAADTPVVLIREYLAGLYGGDGHSPSRISAQDGEGVDRFSGIRFSQSVCEPHRAAKVVQLNIIRNLLARCGVSAEEVGADGKKDTAEARLGRREREDEDEDEVATTKCNKTHRVLDVYIGASSGSAFMDKIGFAYCSYKQHRGEIAAMWFRYREAVARQADHIFALRDDTALGDNRDQRLGTARARLAAREPLLNPAYTSVQRLKQNSNKRGEHISRDQMEMKTLIDVPAFLKLIGAVEYFNNPTDSAYSTTGVYPKRAYGVGPDEHHRTFTLPVIEVSKVAGRCEAVYCIEVEESHNFFANGVVAKNCNHCEDFSLCKTCFAKGVHDEHDFTDMAALAGMLKSDNIGPGSYVKIKLTVTNPKHGWQGAEAGDTGLVMEFDPESSTLTLEMTKSHEEIFMDLSEVEKTDAPEDADRGDDEDKGGYLATLVSLLNRKKDRPDGPGPVPYLDALAVIANNRANGKYKVGEWVRDQQGIVGEIKSYNPQNQQYTFMNNTGYGLRQKTEREIRALGCKPGDTVRILTRRPGEKNFTGQIDSMRQGGGYSPKLGSPFTALNFYIRFAAGGTETFTERDVQPIGIGKWFLSREGDAAPVPVPTSSNISIERNFIDGVPRIDVFIRDNTYTVDLEVGNVVSGDAPVGKLRREPEVAFIRGEEKKAVDDGHVHVISLVFQNGDAAALCDGVPLPVSLTGPISALPDKGTDDASKNLRKQWLSRGLSLDCRMPLSILGCSMQDSDFRGSNFRGPNFPVRYVNWVNVDVEQRPDPLDYCVKWHQVIDLDTSWDCVNCGERVSRLKDACVKCSMPRINKKSKDDLKKYLFASALPGSKEAASVRLWLHGRLRAQYQRELDGIDERAAAAEAAGGPSRRKRGDKNDDNAAIGPRAQ